MAIRKLKTSKKPNAPVSPVAAALPPTPAFTPQGMFDEYRKSFAEAKGANEGRYADILGQYNQRYDRLMGNFNMAGAQEGADINQTYDNQMAAMQQNLVNSGLSGTTVMPVMRAGVDKGRSEEQGRLQERLRKERMGADSQFSKEKLDFMERRTDSYPDAGLYAQLAMQMGEAGMAPPAVGPGGGLPGDAGYGYPEPQAPQGPRMPNNYDDYVVQERVPMGWLPGTSEAQYKDKARGLTDSEKMQLRMGGTVSNMIRMKPVSMEATGLMRNGPAPQNNRLGQRDARIGAMRAPVPMPMAPRPTAPVGMATAMIKPKVKKPVGKISSMLNAGRRAPPPSDMRMGPTVPNFTAMWS